MENPKRPSKLIFVILNFVTATSPVWGVDSVKSTVTVLEEGDFSEEGGGFDWRGYFSVGGYQFLWRSAFRSRGGGLVHPE